MPAFVDEDYVFSVKFYVFDAKYGGFVDEFYEFAIKFDDFGVEFYKFIFKP